MFFLLDLELRGYKTQTAGIPPRVEDPPKSEINMEDVHIHTHTHTHTQYD